MNATRQEPRNPFYLALLGASLVFFCTALAYAIVPTLEDRAIDAGVAPPPSPLRAALRRDGWLWILVELAIVCMLAILSMVLDRWRSLRAERLGRSPEDTSPSTVVASERRPV